MPGAWAFSATLQRGGPTHWQARAIRVDAIAACLRDSRRQSRGGHETVGWLRNFHREQGVRRQTHRHRQVRYMLKAWCSTDRGQRRGGVGSCVHTSRFIRSSQSSSQLHVCSCGASLACTGSCAGRLVLRARTRSLYASSLRYRSRRLAFTRSRQSFQYSRSAPALARRHASRTASAPSCVSGTALHALFYIVRRAKSVTGRRRCPQPRRPREDAAHADPQSAVRLRGSCACGCRDQQGGAPRLAHRHACALQRLVRRSRERSSRRAPLKPGCRRRLGRPRLNGVGAGGRQPRPSCGSRSTVSARSRAA